MSQATIFFTLLSACCIAIGFFTATEFSKGIRFGIIMARVVLAAVAAVFLVGLPTGTLYSHGLDVYWWVFGLAGSLGVLVSALVVLAIAQMMKRLKT